MIFHSPTSNLSTHVNRFCMARSSSPCSRKPDINRAGTKRRQIADDLGLHPVNHHAYTFLSEGREPFLDNLFSLPHTFIRPYPPSVEDSCLLVVEADERFDVLFIDRAFVAVADLKNVRIDITHANFPGLLSKTAVLQKHAEDLSERQKRSTA